MADLRKDIRALARLLEKQGWVVEIKDHVKWIPPSGRDPVFSGSTPSDNRAMKNIVAKLRRRGARI